MSILGEKPKLGFVPANRGFFSSELAAKMRGETIAAMERLGIEVVVPAEDQTEVGCVQSLAEAETCALLTDGYRFLRRLDHRMRIVHDSSVQGLPSGHGLELLARRAGYPDGASLDSAYRRWTSEVRRAYERVLAAV